MKYASLLILAVTLPFATPAAAIDIIESCREQPALNYTDPAIRALPPCATESVIMTQPTPRAISRIVVEEPVTSADEDRLLVPVTRDGVTTVYDLEGRNPPITPQTIRTKCRPQPGEVVNGILVAPTTQAEADAQIDRRSAILYRNYHESTLYWIVIESAWFAAAYRDACQDMRSYTPYVLIDPVQ